jgi:hypothetical protein
MYVLVYETFVGYKIEEYKTHLGAFKEYESIVHSQKGIYAVESLDRIIRPINISFSPFEKEYQEVKKLLLEKYRPFTWLN